MKPVQTKTDFVKRYQAGHFGNRSPTWDSMEDMQEDFDNSYPLLNSNNQLWHIRNRTAGGPTWYDIPGEILADKWKEVGGEGFYISAMAPTTKTLIQGEVQQSDNHIDLFYSQVPKPMRASLLEGGKQVKGILALGLLKTYLCPTSYDWIQELLNLYEGHVIEFSTYSVNWGTVPNVNTVIWEVRGLY